MPQAICVNRRKLWDVQDLDKYIEKLKNGNGSMPSNPWDEL